MAGKRCGDWLCDAKKFDYVDVMAYKIRRFRGPLSDNRQQTTDNRQQTTDNRQQTTDNRQQTKTKNQKPKNMKTLKLLPIILAATLLGASAKVGAATAHHSPDGCSSVNFKLTFKCQDDNVNDHKNINKWSSHITTVKVTNKDILGYIADTLGENIDGAQLVVCFDEGSAEASICQGIYKLWYPSTDEYGPVLTFEDPENNDVETPIISSWCDCEVTTGSMINIHGCPTGHWHTDTVIGFDFRFLNTDYDYFYFQGPGKIKTEVKYQAANALHEEGCTTTQSFNVSVAGCAQKNNDNRYDYGCYVTGHVTGSGVNSTSTDWWFDWWTNVFTD